FQIDHSRIELLVAIFAYTLLRLPHQSQHVRRHSGEPLTGPKRMTLCRVLPFQKIPRRFIQALELLGVAGLGFGVGGQVLAALFLYPASGRWEAVVREVVSLRHRQHPTGLVKSLLNIRGGVLTEATLKLPAPDFRRRVGVVAQAAEDLEEMPVPLELPIVI